MQKQPPDVFSMRRCSRPSQDSFLSVQVKSSKPQIGIAKKNLHHKYLKGTFTPKKTKYSRVD